MRSPFSAMKSVAARPGRSRIREALAARKEAKRALHRAAANDVLITLNRSGKHIYAGTVPAAEVARRRAKNKVARASRRANRSR